MAPKVQQKDSLVEFLGSQPPTQSDLASPENAEGDDVALKLDKPEDIDAQGGEADERRRRRRRRRHQDHRRRATSSSRTTCNPDAATFSFKIEPDWSGSDQTDNALLQLRGQHEWSNRLELVKNGEFLRFILTDNTGREADISVRITDWVAGQEHDVRATLRRRTTRALHRRSRGRQQHVQRGELQVPAGDPAAGRRRLAGQQLRPANSTIRDFTITNSAAHDG